MNQKDLDKIDLRRTKGINKWYIGIYSLLLKLVPNVLKEDIKKDFINKRLFSDFLINICVLFGIGFVFISIASDQKIDIYKFLKVNTVIGKNLGNDLANAYKYFFSYAVTVYAVRKIFIKELESLIKMNSPQIARNKKYINFQF